MGNNKKKKIRKIIAILVYVFCAALSEVCTGWIGALLGGIEEPDRIQYAAKVAAIGLFWVLLLFGLAADGIQIFLAGAFVKARADLDKIHDSKVKAFEYLDKMFEDSGLKEKEIKNAENYVRFLEKREMAIKEVM